jgi:hypothetical protein
VVVGGESTPEGPDPKSKNELRAKVGRIAEERERSDTPSHEGGEREKKKKIKNGWRKKKGKENKTQFAYR